MEILGVSLPWSGVFRNEGAGAKLIELAGNSQKDANPYLASADINSFSSVETVSPSVPQGAATSNWVDLLTGGDMLSDLVPEPVTTNTPHAGDDLLGFLDQAVVEHHDPETDHKTSSTQDKRSTDSGTQQYINCLKSLAGPHMV